MPRPAIFAVIAVAGLASPAWAGEGSAERGGAYSAAMCASCHSVAADQAASPNPDAKPFRTITVSDPSGAELAKWFNTAHPSTGRSLKDSQAEDIALYIQSLKAGKAD
ncbi:MAG: c-type cytochrome [Hyphomonadaceae bacterium]